MNAGTRVLSTKAAATVPTVEELREQERALGLEDLGLSRVRGEERERMFELLRTPVDAKSKPTELATKRHAPITIKSYRID
jgi:hypothetical protein